MIAVVYVVAGRFIISTLFDYSLTRHIEALGCYEQFKKLMADCMIKVLDASIYPGLKAA